MTDLEPNAESIPLDTNRIQLLIHALEESYGYSPPSEAREQPSATPLDPSALVRDIAEAEWLIEKLRKLIPSDGGEDNEPLALIRPRNNAAHPDTL